MNAKNPSLFFGLWSRFCLFLESCRAKMEHDVCCITRIYHEKLFPNQKPPECTVSSRHFTIKGLQLSDTKSFEMTSRVSAGHTLSADPFLLCFSLTLAL